MKRLAGALLISLVGIALSWVFLRPKEWSQDSVSTKQAVARVVEVRNDVSRQPEGRLMWSPIRAGDQLYVGDKIKTAGLSTTVVQLEASESKLEIEENSIIVMGQGEKKLALNMLEGRVFVQEGAGVDLVSGGKKIDVSSNSAITVSQDGTSQVENFAGGQGVFNGLIPAYSETVLSAKAELEIQWQAGAREGTVEIAMGESPLLLKTVSGKSVAFSGGRLSVPFRPGLNYWQLTLKSPDRDLKSPLMKLTLVRPQSPTPLYPASNEAVRGSDRPFDFKWVKGNTGDSVRLEVARDENFQTLIVSSNVKDQTFFAPDQVLATGNYFWRVRSQLPGGDWLSSNAVPFTVHVGNAQVSPTPVSPQDHAQLFMGAGSPRRVRLAWRKQAEATGYEVRVKGPDAERTLSSDESFLELPVSAAGKYGWEVYSLDQSGKRSVLPTTRDFDVKARGVINWTMDEKKFSYLKSLPILVLKWQKTYSGYSTLLISASPDLSNPETFQVRESDFPYRVMKDGLYYAQVRALSDDDEVRAESSVIQLQVQEAPLPPAPEVRGSADVLRANSQGSLKLDLTNMLANWLAVAQLRDPTGKILDERRFSSPHLQFAGLLPGNYLLLIKYNDDYKRSSEIATFKLEVPATSKMPAPKIKGIKVR